MILLDENPVHFGQNTKRSIYRLIKAAALVSIRVSSYEDICRYTCFNQRARVSLYCNTYALLVGGCLVLLFSAAVIGHVPYARDA